MAESRHWLTVCLTEKSKNVARFLALIGPTIVAHTPVWGQTQDSNFSAYATLSSDYPNRGISQTDETAALQLGVDYQHRSGLFAGAWVSNVDFRTESFRDEPRAIEVDYYVGYNWLTEDWSLAATLVHYSYPGASFNYDYTELIGRIGFHERFYYTLSYTDGLLSHDSSALGHELEIEWPLPWSTRLGAALGRFDSADVGGGAYEHWNIGISKPVRRFGLDLRYYDTDYDRVSPLGIPLRASWVLSLSYQL